MKKILFLVCVIFFSFSLSSCKNKASKEMDVVKIEADKILFNSVDEIEKMYEMADLIILGSYGDDLTQEDIYDEEGVKMSIKRTRATIKVDKTFKGEELEEIPFSVLYGIEDGKIITVTDMKPIESGTSWIFFLSYNEYLGTYNTFGDYTTRYPKYDEFMKDLITGKKNDITSDKVGLYDVKLFNLDMYKGVLEKLEII